MPLPKHSTICPMDTFLRLLTGPWTLYILWVLRTNGPTRFGALKRQLEGISSKVLTERLRMLEAAALVYRHYEPTVPPQVTYSLTERMRDLIVVFDQLNDVAQRWYGPDAASPEGTQPPVERQQEVVAGGERNAQTKAQGGKKAARRQKFSKADSACVRV